MRPLWPIERAALEATAQDYPALAETLRQQADEARVTQFANSGAGFFSTISVSADAPLLLGHTRLEGAVGTLEGLQHGMAFVAFFEDGRLSVIEGYSQGGGATADIDFAVVPFEVRAWGKAND